jgi:hypothetical protein
VRCDLWASLSIQLHRSQPTVNIARDCFVLGTYRESYRRFDLLDVEPSTSACALWILRRPCTHRLWAWERLSISVSWRRSSMVRFRNFRQKPARQGIYKATADLYALLPKFQPICHSNICLLPTFKVWVLLQLLLLARWGCLPSVNLAGCRFLRHLDLPGCILP